MSDHSDDKNKEFATLTLPDGRSLKLPMFHDAFNKPGEGFIDISNLNRDLGVLTYDPGFSSTAGCTSTITYIDGNEGKCLYRGYPVAQLAQSSTYTEVCYLLLFGELPDKKTLAKFDCSLKDHMMVHEKFKEFFGGFRYGSHPMAIMVAVVGAMSAFYHDGVDWRAEQERDITALRVIPKMCTLAAVAYKTAIGQPISYPRKDLSFSENFLHMMFSTPLEPYHVNPLYARSLDTFMILHADHEQNASTATVRTAGSSLANPYACIAAGIACLWGPAHGGANEAVIQMLYEIGSVENIPAFIQQVKDKKVRLMGFGHRVYKNYDPRAKIMKETTMKVLEYNKQRSIGVATGDMDDDHILKLAMELEKIALADEYFISRKLYPNVDFYSGILLRVIGIPISMYTVLFALSRCVGWISQWREMITEPNIKIGRPRQCYNGKTERSYVSIEQRPVHTQQANNPAFAPFDVRRLTPYLQTVSPKGASCGQPDLTQGETKMPEKNLSPSQATTLKHNSSFVPLMQMNQFHS